MSHKGKHQKQIQILPPIDEDEAEFWMIEASPEKNRTSDHLSTSKDFSSDLISPDGLYSESYNQFDTEMQDRLSLLYKEGIEKQAKEVEDNTQNTRLSEIVEFDENIPSTNMSFFDRLLHQITRPSVSEADYLNDDVFTEIDGSEIPTTINDNTEINKNKLTVNSSFMNIIRSFIDDLNAEANVIRGVADQHVFINQQSLKAKSSLPPIDNNRITLF